MEELNVKQKAKFKKRVLNYRGDPLLFCREILGNDEHWEKQVDIMRSVAANKYTTVRSGHSTGKSYCVADIVLWYLYCFPESIVLTTAGTYRQVEKVLWAEIRSHYLKSKIPLGGQLLEMEIKLGPKWFALGFSSDAQDAFQGFHSPHILVIVDEASGVPDSTFEQIDSLMTNEGAKLLLVGNPVRSGGYFAETFSQQGWNKIYVSYF